MNKQAGTFIKDRYTFEEFRSLIHSLSDGVIIDEQPIAEAYEGMQFYDLTKIELDEETIKTLPRKVALKAEAILLKNTGASVIVGMINPLNAKSITLVESTLGSSFTPVFVTEKDFRQLMGRYYSQVPEILKIAHRFKPERSQEDKAFVGAVGIRNDVEALFHLVMQEALQVQASDIHIEDFEGQLTIRFRVDGILREHKIPKTQIGDYLLRYIKILANVDIAEEKRPIDGQHVSVNVGTRRFNIRLSIIPSAFGYSIVMRLLGEATHLSLRKIISDSSYADEISNYLGLKQGVFIVSGPTGSGKTTTLLSALSEVNRPDKKIITVEDPVESKVAGITQVQINEKIGFTFGAALRSILRQDPDVIMVGEVRDEVTANTAIRAAVTGHMVLATIHTRSVSDIPARLMDLGVDPFSLSMALRLLVSQRLIRVLCESCKEPHTISSEESTFLKKAFPTFKGFDGKNLFKASEAGCEFCHHTGYSGRTIIYELLKTTPEMVIALGEKDFKNYYHLVNKALEGKRLIDSAMRIALKGNTDLDEVLSFSE